MNIQLRPPCTYPDSSLEFFCDIFYTRSTPSYLPRLFSPTQTGLLPYAKTLISTPEGPATMKRNRTKKMEKEKENEERWFDIFLFISWLPTRKFQKNQNFFKKKKQKS